MPESRRQRQPRHRLGCADRKSLLLGTALASTLLIGTVIVPAPAQAVTPCIQPASPNPISDFNVADAITCVNTEARTGDGVDPDAISLTTSAIGAGHSIYLNNSGDLTSTAADGIYTYTYVPDSGIDIINTGDIDTAGRGIFARTAAAANNSPLSIINSGGISGTDALFGIYASTYGEDSDLSIVNSGDIDLNDATGQAGLFGVTRGSMLSIVNRGSLSGGRFGIRGRTTVVNSPLDINNMGDIWVASSTDSVYGIHAATFDPNSPISIVNSADIWATTSGFGSDAFGIRANARDPNSPISIHNSGDIWARATGALNSYASAYGIDARAQDNDSPITIHNSASIDAKAPYQALGILALSGDPYGSTTNGAIRITNSGDIRAEANGTAGYPFSVGIFAISYGQNSPITIHNSGSVYAKGGDSRGIYAYNYYNLPTKITNTGDISSESHFAIDVYGFGTAHIYNAGRITGYVNLTDQNDRFVNQAGGVFETKLTSFFGGGSDLFRNAAGGTVLAATDPNARETSAFEGLERFENWGLISLQDGATGDVFRIADGAVGLTFVGADGSTLAVDAFLGGPGSTADNFIIDGNVSGTTAVTVNNTNAGPGVFNPTGIPVVFVTGATPDAGAFFLDQPVDAGFFDYDLFFVPTGSGFWELRSFAGAGAFLLPQLVTAAQDIWHQGASTWFDRTADLRVLLAGGAAPALDQGGKSLGGVPQDGITPAMWVRGSGSWLDRDDSASTSAYGRNYRFNLDRELETIDFQMGIDLGTRDFLSPGDVLVFGVLGGFVHADLDYDQINRDFDFDGGQVGVYATYLKGGLFVDTLLNVHLYELDANNALGFPSKLDGTTVGLRTDTGYRFGSFTGGIFFEPLATIEVTWADIDGFRRGGNSVRFDDDANVRGRLGLRAGTTMEAWEGTLMEPFVVGSLWGNLSDDNSATLVSTGRTFQFQDDLEDVWGEVSAGLNFFNFDAGTTVFAKVDVTFGDDVSGVGGKAGMRVVW